MRVLMACFVAVAVGLTAPAASADMSDDCVQTRDHALSIDACTRVIASGNWSGRNLAWAYNNRGNAYRALGQYDRAIRDLSEAIRLRTDYVVAYTNRGYAFFLMRDYNSALFDLDRAVDLDPDYALAYENRSLVHCKLWNTEAGYEDMKRAIEMGSWTARQAQNWLGEMGFYAGPVTGVYDTVLDEALLSWMLKGCDGV